MESTAIPILKRAVEMDTKEQYTLALILYQEGLQILLNSIKDVQDKSKQEYLRIKAKEYMERAEKIKKLIDEGKASGKYREHTKIEAGSIKHGYDSTFGRFLDNSITYILVEDPYIRAYHQIMNFVRFCELAVTKCHLLKKITLTTTQDSENPRNQMTRLEELKRSLRDQSITLEINFSETLHDRQISLSSGWIIKIGRGLDYFKAPEGKFVLGSCDLELRPCLETTVDIFHKSHLRT
ncbi:MIT domain-containing protein 1-like [Chelonus insularis]|uniref:MIT domain-containing protein 1-like n=1 Tax=Chelonus insularis TaxID=460826 RepID=UPI00158C7EE2|nr:MIT domain-containing protein 1-like [Chelonus insularis]